MQGSRNLTVANLLQFAQALGLKGDEVEYFEALVLANQAKTTLEEKHYGARLRRIRAAKPRRTGKLSLDKHLSQWYFPAVYLCLKNEPAEGAVARTATKLGLETQAVQAVVTELTSRGVLTIQDGCYRIEYEHLVLGGKSKASVVQKQFLESQLKLSLEAFRKKQAAGGGPARFFSHTLSTTEDQYEKYVARVNGFLADITASAQDEASEKMLQVNVQLFPLA